MENMSLARRKEKVLYPVLFLFKSGVLMSNRFLQADFFVFENAVILFKGLLHPAGKQQTRKTTR